VNRRGFDPRPYDEARINNIPKGSERFDNRWLLHGPDSTVVADAEKPIRGTVKEADTGRGRPGIEVRLIRNGHKLLRVMPHTKTDAKGCYELRGARKAASYMLQVASDPAAGYMGCQAEVADTPGNEPVTGDIRVAKGVVITGRVIDKSTGNPVPGFVLAGVLSDNAYVKDYPKFDSPASLENSDTADAGRFRVVTIPGPVLLMGGPDLRRSLNGQVAWFQYKPAVADPKYPQYFPTRAVLHGMYYTVGGAITPIQGNFCKVLEIKAGTAVVEQDIVLEPAAAQPVQIRDADGRPLRGTWVTGMSSENWHRPEWCETDTCSAYHLEPGKPRLMVFYEPKRKLAATLTLGGSEKGLAIATLRPAGSVKGRLADEDGKPLTGVVVNLRYPDREADLVHEAVHETRQLVTDLAGTFALDDVIPGLKFELLFRRGKLDFERERKSAKPTAPVKPGECRDLGEIRQTVE
jgi:hypothetical protein